MLTVPHSTKVGIWVKRSCGSFRNEQWASFHLDNINLISVWFLIIYFTDRQQNIQYRFHSMALMIQSFLLRAWSWHNYLHSYIKSNSNKLSSFEHFLYTSYVSAQLSNQRRIQIYVYLFLFASVSFLIHHNRWHTIVCRMKSSTSIRWINESLCISLKWRKQ